jgi:hypothetical protein
MLIKKNDTNTYFKLNGITFLRPQQYLQNVHNKANHITNHFLFLLQCFLQEYYNRHFGMPPFRCKSVFTTIFCFLVRITIKYTVYTGRCNTEDWALLSDMKLVMDSMSVVSRFQL